MPWSSLALCASRISIKQLYYALCDNLERDRSNRQPVNRLALSFAPNLDPRKCSVLIQLVQLHKNTSTSMSAQSCKTADSSSNVQLTFLRAL